MSNSIVRRVGAFAVSALVLLTAGCLDVPSGPDTERFEYGVVLNKGSNSLTVFPVGAPEDRYTIDLGAPVGATDVAVDRGRAVVPLASTDQAVVVDLQSPGEIIRRIDLPPQEEFGGISFVRRDRVLIANTSSNSVILVDIGSGEVSPPVPVGPRPQEVLFAGDYVFVLNSDNTISVFNLRTLGRVSTIELSAANPVDLVLGVGQQLYVLNAGTPGEADASLSVVGARGLQETKIIRGFGGGVSGLAIGPDNLLYIASRDYGVAVYDPRADEFIRSPDNPLQPGAVPTSAVQFDRVLLQLFTLDPGCAAGAHGTVFRLNDEYQVQEQVPTGNCSVDLDFTLLRG